MSGARTYRWLPVVVFAVAVLGARAQQDPMYTMYWWNTLAVNPGYAGSADHFTATALARQQWVGLSGAPSTQTISGHTPLPMESLGVGLSAVHDQAGPVNNTVLYADLAYRLRVTENARLAFGLRAAIDMLQVKLGDLANVDANDPLFGQDLSGGAKANFGAGLYYWTQKGYIGLSVPKILEQDRQTMEVAGITVDAMRQRRHFFLIGGHVFALGKDVKLRPSFLVKAVEGAPLGLDLSMLLVLREKLWLGAAYRAEDAIGAIAAFQFTHRFRAGYAHDFGTSELRTQHSGTHEIVITFDFRRKDGKELTSRLF